MDIGRSGLEPLSYSEINAYKASTGVFMNTMDVRAIKAMDNARIKASAEIEKEK